MDAQFQWLKFREGNFVHIVNKNLVSDISFFLSGDIFLHMASGQCYIPDSNQVKRILNELGIEKVTRKEQSK